MSELSSTVINGIDKLLTKYPADQRQSAIISALMLAQQNNHGYLSSTLIEQVADYLCVPHIAAYEVATFYSMFDLQPVGKHKLELCTNISCMLRGSNEIAAYLQKKLGIDFNQTTPDGKFIIKSVECLAACGGAPAMQVGSKYYENLTIDKVEQLLKDLT